MCQTDKGKDDSVKMGYCSSCGKKDFIVDENGNPNFKNIGKPGFGNTQSLCSVCSAQKPMPKCRPMGWGFG